MAKSILAVGAGEYVGGKAAHALTGLDTRRIERQGLLAMWGAAFVAALQLLGEVGSVILDHEGLQAYDVRHDTPERRAANRRETEQMMRSIDATAVPADAADRVALQERLITAMQHVTCPDDTCGWYRFGWDMHNALMERILEDAGLATALALAKSAHDGPQLMRLARVPQEEVACNRFWFGFRDANHAMAAQLAPFGAADADRS